MENIRFSVIAPAIREHNYMKVYNSINYNNHTNFEMVFVGNRPPKNVMPKNFRYIFSDKSPACCLEIAARLSKGEYLLATADDVLYSENFLDRFDYYIEKFKDEPQKIIGCRYKLYGTMRDEALTMDATIKDSPAWVCTANFKREIWLSIGGIDIRFDPMFVLCNGDMLSRFYEIGYELFIAPDIWHNEIEDNIIRSSLWGRFGVQGRDLINILWKKDGKISKNRLDSVHSFPDNITDGLI